MERYLVGADGLSPEAAREHVTGLIEDRERLRHVREEALGWLGELARAGDIRLLGHDPDSAAEIAGLAERGGAVAEFPTTLEAAEAAREAGMPIVMGAPNVLRGGSHSGNVSAVELAERGLVDALASDYLPAGLLAAVWTLAGRRVATLPQAARLVTAGAATVAGRARTATPGRRTAGARWPRRSSRGADGTGTMRVDELVEAAIAVDGTPREALTAWFDTGRCWRAVAGEPAAYRTSGRSGLDGAAVSLLRPKPSTRDAWWRITERAARIRILSTTCLEAVLVAEGSIDAFADPGGDVHRIVDLAAAMVTVPAAGGAVIDARGRPLELDPDLTRRWSGVIAATPELAEEIVTAIQG